MNKRIASGLMFLSLGAMAASTATAAPTANERIALLPVSGTNVHPGFLEAARDLLKDDLYAAGRYAVVNLPGDPGTVETSAADALAAGRQANADLVVLTHFIRLAGTGRLRMVVYRVTTGEVTHADSITVAGGPDELDPALKRLVAGFLGDKRAAGSADIETVTTKEADPLLKEAATRTFGLRLSMLAPVSRVGSDSPATVAGVGIFWLYDARSYLADVFLDLHSGDRAHSFDIGIGLYYPFRRTNITPYLGGSGAYAVSSYGGEEGSGLRLQPVVGMLFGRLSTVQLRAEVGYFVDTFGERATNPDGLPATGDRHYAHGAQLALGIGF